MALKIITGMSQKVGTANYGSVGASCSVEFEADQGLLQSDLAAFHRQVRIAYTACAQAVDNELTRHRTQAEGSADGNGHGHADAPTQRSPTTGNGRCNGHHNGNGRRATASQIRAIHAIVNRRGLDLVETLRGHGVEHAEDLSITAASQLIDDLKAQSDGAGGRR